MTRNRISLTHVDLHYSASAFAHRSLKSWLTDRLRGRREVVVRDIHALKDITLEISPGERVGLIGANGAGKSSLLKMIAGLYPPSGGLRNVNGVVRSIFEIGLGFEPDATGRENILYRGFLLGMTPKQVRSIEEEIVAFSELAEFIDYPVKTYSAGMLVRLAFAISTAVEGDILLLDEVIGAGDAGFMVKARKRIQKLVEGAEILVLASHDMSALAGICQRGVLLQHGAIAFDGAITEAISQYKKLTATGDE
ncbi:ABC transporter ATP-binding protein [Bradyrhizobium diazoefficiens]|nr:ABC transporter ATP-binding protein [Bradyrhizobium diazoefficiens]MBR0850301.1 ABC transporter ATP-binding protein [Bradyrhizobium diazoefficiens]